MVDVPFWYWFLAAMVVLALFIRDDEHLSPLPWVALALLGWSVRKVLIAIGSYVTRLLGTTVLAAATVLMFIASGAVLWPPAHSMSPQANPHASLHDAYCLDPRDLLTWFDDIKDGDYTEFPTGCYHARSMKKPGSFVPEGKLLRPGAILEFESFEGTILNSDAEPQTFYRIKMAHFAHET